VGYINFPHRGNAYAQARSSGAEKPQNIHGRCATPSDSFRHAKTKQTATSAFTAQKGTPMSLTTLDTKTALIVIDLQNGIVALPTVHTVDNIVQQSRRLADAFRGKGLPVVLVNVAGGAPGRAEQSRSLGQLPPGWADLVPELNQQASDHLVTKHTWGAFTNTDLDAYLKSNGVTQVVIVGVATSIGVESTARQAHELGYNVTLALDAMTDLNLDAHINSTTRMFPRLGETGTTAEILDLLERTSA
jgi:nicotinamidase-related amidase